MLLAFFFFVPLALVLYHLVLFPAGLLYVASKKTDTSPPPLADDDLPTIDLMIAARNEEASIAGKLENSLELNYPKEKLRIIVLANGCTDSTVDIVKSFEDRGIILFEDGPIGKVMAQNNAVQRSDADVIVFSDANTHYNLDALRLLVSHFQDETVGVACGRHIYVNTDDPTGAGEGFYWNNIETRLKKAESALGGLIGANGSIYALRRELYVPMPNTVISDFIEPLSIALNGYRTVYEPRAHSYEDAEPTFKQEYARKARTVRRTAYSLVVMPWLLDPRKSGSLAYLIFSHKVLRWFTPVLLLLALTAATLRILSGKDHQLDRLFFTGMTLFGFLALLGRGIASDTKVPGLTQIYYVALMFRAAMQGLYEAFTEGHEAVWDHARSAG